MDIKSIVLIAFVSFFNDLKILTAKAMILPPRELKGDRVKVFYDLNNTAPL